MANNDSIFSDAEELEAGVTAVNFEDDDMADDAAEAFDDSDMGSEDFEDDDMGDMDGEDFEDDDMDDMDGEDFEDDDDDSDDDMDDDDSDDEDLDDMDDDMDDDDMDDDDMDDEDISDSLQNVLDTNGVDLEAAKGFIQANLGNTALIGEILASNDMSLEDLATLMDADANTANEYLDENGLSLDGDMDDDDMDDDDMDDDDMDDDDMDDDMGDNDMDDDDMDDDDSDDISDTLQGVLEANNVNLDEAKAFMQNNLASADVIYQIMSENGLSNEDIALLLDLDSASDVENYFEENGIGMDDSDDDMDDSDDDMDDSDNDGISDDTEETLSNLGLEVEDTKDFIVGNLESPEDIFNFAQENGLSNSLLAELFSDINEDDVSAYFESNGFDNDTSDDSEANLMITGQNSDNGSDFLV